MVIRSCVIVLGSKLQCQEEEEHRVEEDFQTGCNDYPEADDTEKLDSEGNLCNMPVEASKEHEGEATVEGDSNTISSAKEPAIEGNSLASKTKRIRKLLQNKVRTYRYQLNTYF